MKRNKIIYLLLVLILTTFTIGTLSAQTGIVPKLPQLKLSVTQSPLAIYPPIMIYTAQLSYVPIITTAVLKVEFYHLQLGSYRMIYLGSARVDKTGKAVLSKQIRPGKYVALSKIIIYNKIIWSNKVEYKVY